MCFLVASFGAPHVTYFKMGTAVDAKNGVEVRKVRFSSLTIVFLYKFFLRYSLFKLVCYIYTLVTYVTMWFLVALCGTCHATYFKMAIRGYKTWDMSEKGKSFYLWKLFSIQNVFYLTLFVWNCLLHMYSCYTCNHVFSFKHHVRHDMLHI